MESEPPATNGRAGAYDTNITKREGCAGGAIGKGTLYVFVICALENHLSINLNCQLEEENLKLQGEMVDNSEAMEGNEAEEKRRLDLLDEVSWSEFDGRDRT